MGGKNIKNNNNKKHGIDMSELSSSPAIRGSCANIAASVSFVLHSVIKFFRIGQKSPKPTYDTRTDIKSKKNQFLSEGDMGYETLKEKKKKRMCNSESCINLI